MANLSSGGAKFAQGQKVTTPAGAGEVHRVVAGNLDATCEECGSHRVKLGARDYRYWVVLDGETDEQARKFTEADLGGLG